MKDKLNSLFNFTVCIYRLGPPQTHCLLLLTNSWHDNDSVPITGPAGLLLFPTVIQDSVQTVPVSPWKRCAEDWKAYSMLTQPCLYYPQPESQSLLEPH